MDEFYDSDFDEDCRYESEEEKEVSIYELMIKESEAIIKNELENIQDYKKKLEELK